MARYTKLYSVGNDDATENSYETARLEITLDVDTSGCQQADQPDGTVACIGEVKVKLEYTATASTGDQMFVTVGPAFALRDGGQGGGSAQLQHTAAGAAGPAGDTLTATLDLAPIPCSGGKLRGTVDVELRPGGGAFRGNVPQRISYRVSIRPCGQIFEAEVSAVSNHYLSMIGGRIETPLHDITPPAGGGNPPEAPWPAHPGVPC